MKTFTNTASTQAPQDLVDEFKALVTEAEALMVDSQSENSAGVLGNLRARFAAAQDRCGDLYTKTKHTVVSGARQTDALVRENPYQSLAIAAGVGLLVGVLLGRRSR